MCVLGRLCAILPDVLAAERRHLVLRALDSYQSVTVAGLANRLHVSPMTIRRDLEALARSGKLTRVHGGAIATWDTAAPIQRAPATFEENVVYRLAEKDRIGAAAAALVHDGETVLLDVGTTTLQAARHLRDRHVTLITNNLGAYEELQSASDIEIILLGGVVDRHYRSSTGFLAEDALRQIRADRLLLSASAIRASDLSVLDDTAVDVRLKRGMIAAAGEVILLVDSEKFACTRPARVCGPSELDVLITDADAPLAALADFQAAGVRVIRT
jgi:DeoR/GlpR family transcriptional regulator of sugar metabolism